jgi:hypothetical protein
VAVAERVLLQLLDLAEQLAGHRPGADQRVLEPFPQPPFVRVPAVRVLRRPDLRGEPVDLGQRGPGVVGETGAAPPGGHADRVGDGHPGRGGRGRIDGR